MGALSAVVALALPPASAQPIPASATPATAAIAARQPLTPAQKAPPLSGAAEYRDVNFGNGLTECPQAGRPDMSPRPLDRRLRDRVERLSNRGGDQRANQDFSCFAQDEMSISASPRHPKNLVGGANDYRLGYGTSGFYASTDGGKHWYDGIIPVPSLPNGDNLDGGGDPAIAHDRDGVAYYADINFNRTDDTNGVFVSRSTNGGFTWSRPCVPINGASMTDNQAVCGGTGDPRQPGDGVISFIADGNTAADGSVAFNDKEYIAVGRRPAGVAPQCFGPETDTVVPCRAGTIGSDRVYVTWTLFDVAPPAGGGDSRIYVSYSDDRARSWSPPREISGSAPFCIGGPANACNFNQGSVPTVQPRTGALYVAFFNGNTPDEDQYLSVRSTDGGRTFTAPSRITPIFDLNYPRAGITRPDCTPRGQSTGRQVLTNNCFRVNSFGAITVDKRGGRFANDLYAVISDNRNGTIRDSNVDVFLFKSTDGGESWIGPTRVNDDRSRIPAGFDRDCGRPEGTLGGTDTLSQCTVRQSGNDQWFPWVDVSQRGDVNVVFHDRRLDQRSQNSEWPASRTRTGNYLTQFWGGQCRVTRANSRQCTAPEATRYTGRPGAAVNPPRGRVPGQVQRHFPYRNFTISDVPYNLDYSFRAGIFMGDYENVDVQGTRAHALWTDSRNGRSSRDQFGRNPACEQSDALYDGFNARRGGNRDRATGSDAAFLVTACPVDAADVGARRGTSRSADLGVAR